MIRPFLVVLDCDGTLVDAQAGIVAAMAASFAAEGFAAPDPAAVRRTVGLSLAAAVARLAPDRDHAVIDRLAEGYKDAFLELRQRPDHAEPLYPGAVEALDLLEAQGAVLAVATGKGRRGLDASLDRHGLRHRFATLVTADDAPGKPAPDMLLIAMAETRIGADRTVMVGDTSYDMAMARAARVSGIGVAWGYHVPEELLSHGAALVLDRFADLPGAVAPLLAAVA